MPTYLYLCERCGEFERRQSIHDAALSTCPTCAGPVCRQIPPGVGIIVKGHSPGGGECDRSTPCCGRETRCDRPRCSS